MRELLDNGSANQIPDLLRTATFGALLSKLVLAAPADETALDPSVAPVVNTITLAVAPLAILHVLAVAGAGTLGMLTLKIGVPGVVDPAPGEVVWNGPGSKDIRFNAADAWTDVDVWYTDSADMISLLERYLGQSDV
jgi:hypothetical protein